MKEKPIAPHSPRVIPWIVGLGNKWLLTSLVPEQPSCHARFHFLRKPTFPSPSLSSPRYAIPDYQSALWLDSSYSKPYCPPLPTIWLPYPWIFPPLTRNPCRQFIWYSCRALNAMFLPRQQETFSCCPEQGTKRSMQPAC